MCDDEVHDKMHPNTTMAYQQGVKGNRVLFVFESPGRLEHELNRPVVGETGAHLCILCERLRALAANNQNKSLRDIGKDFCKVGASIINVAPDYLPITNKDKNKNSYQLNPKEREAFGKELLHRQEFNILLRQADVIVCFGRLAWDMGDIIESKLNCCGNKYKIIYTYHLSGRASRKFEGFTWPEKMNQLANKIVRAFEDEELSSDFTDFKNKHKRLPVQPKERT